MEWWAEPFSDATSSWSPSRMFVDFIENVVCCPGSSEVFSADYRFKFSRGENIKPQGVEWSDPSDPIALSSRNWTTKTRFGNKQQYGCVAAHTSAALARGNWTYRETRIESHDCHHKPSAAVICRSNQFLFWVLRFVVRVMFSVISNQDRIWIRLLWRSRLSFGLYGCF